ncbi:hypothetical protein BKA69DRAFT_1175892 [Paraphysoderma sedebokerense]|nr:hypothetical protein BKA69DRAFT_1175892 [Paraphysoderma sedebokerense]
MYHIAQGSLVSSDSTFRLLLQFIIAASLVASTFGQSRWQDVTNFHPYCVRLFRTCVQASSNSLGQCSGEICNTAIGICGNKMAICTFSDSLTWPWSTGQERPALTSVDATSRLAAYRNALENSPIASPPTFQSAQDFLPDCRAEFRRCVDGYIGGVQSDVHVGICGNGMSVCTERQGRWPYGDDTSLYWQLPYTDATLQIYRNAYSGNNGNPRVWQTSTVFLPICRGLMAQCVPISGGQLSDVAIGDCGNRMAICTFENILWPHTDDATNAYNEPYDTRWQRYNSALNPNLRWQDLTRFSLSCTNRFFQCVFAAGGRSSDSAVGICGNQMSLCTFNQNNWPITSNLSMPFETEPYISRLGIYRSMFGFMTSSATSYSAFPPASLEITSSPLPTSSIFVAPLNLQALFFSHPIMPYNNNALPGLNRFIIKAWSAGRFRERTFAPVTTVLTPYGDNHGFLYVNNWENAWWVNIGADGDVLVIEFDTPRFVSTVTAMNFQPYGNYPGGNLHVHLVESISSANILTMTRLGSIDVAKNTNALGTLVVNRMVRHLVFTRSNTEGWSRIENIIMT